MTTTKGCWTNVNARPRRVISITLLTFGIFASMVVSDLLSRHGKHRAPSGARSSQRRRRQTVAVPIQQAKSSMVRAQPVHRRSCVRASQHCVGRPSHILCVLSFPRQLSGLNLGIST